MRPIAPLRLLISLHLAAGLLSAASPALPVEDGPVVAHSPEVVRYRWRLEGLHGFLARLLPLVPSTGDGVLSTTPSGQDRLLCRFHATSPKAAEEEHWTYTVEIDTDTPRTLRVVDSLVFRGKHKEKTFDLADQEVLDVLSGLHLLTHSIPETEERGLIWSNRKVYGVVITPHGLVKRRIGDREMDLRYVTIRGLQEPGQKRWRSRAEIWLTADDPATPVEILYSQSLGRLRLVMNEPSPPPSGSAPVTRVDRVR